MLALLALELLLLDVAEARVVGDLRRAAPARVREQPGGENDGATVFSPTARCTHGVTHWIGM